MPTELGRHLFAEVAPEALGHEATLASGIASFGYRYRVIEGLPQRLKLLFGDIQTRQSHIPRVDNPPAFRVKHAGHAVSRVINHEGLYVEARREVSHDEGDDARLRLYAREIHPTFELGEAHELQHLVNLP
jgi:hypothetical protein